MSDADQDDDRRQHSVGNASALADGFKISLHSPDFFEHQLEQWQQRLPFVGSNFAEAYLSGHAEVRLGVCRFESPVGKKVGDHYAFVKVATRTQDKAGVPVANPPAVKPADSAACCDCDEFHMLVHIRHAEDGAEIVVPSVVRSCPHDRLAKMGVEVPEISTAGSDKPFKVVASGKVNLGRFCRAGAHTGTGDGDLVERGSQLVNELAGHDVDQLRRLGAYDQFHEFVAGLRIDIEYETGRVFLKELVLQGLQIDEVMLCAS